MSSTWPGRLKQRSYSEKIPMSEVPSQRVWGRRSLSALDCHSPDVSRPAKDFDSIPRPSVRQRDVPSVQPIEPTVMSTLSRRRPSEAASAPRETPSIHTEQLQDMTPPAPVVLSVQQPATTSAQVSVGCQTHFGQHNGQPARLRNAIIQVAQARNEVSGQRIQLQCQRRALSYARGDESRLRRELMKRLTAVFSEDLSPEFQALLSELEKLEAASDSYLQLEKQYNDAEAEFEGKESDLTKVEGSFDLLLQQEIMAETDQRYHTDADDKDVSFHEEEDVASEDSASTISAHQQDVPPSMFQYLSLEGDVQLLEERLAELEFDYLTIQENQAYRSRFDMKLGEDSVEFLRDYDSNHARILKELEAAKAERDRAWAICRDEGLFDIDDNNNDDHHHHQAQDADNSEPVNELELDADKIAIKPDEPLKLTESLDSAPFFESNRSAEPSFDSTHFINKWILHALRHSQVEIMRLKAVPQLEELMNHGWNWVDISRLALFVWFSDDLEAASPPSTASNGSEGMDGFVLDPLGNPVLTITP